MRQLAIPLMLLLAACDEPPKKDPSAASAKAKAPVAAPAPTPEPKPEVVAPKPRDCKAGVAVDFGDEAVEKEVRRKLQKEKGTISLADLGKVKTLKLSQAKLTRIDNCVFPHLKNAQGLFFGPGKIVDLSPLAKLTKLFDLKLPKNPVVDLKPLAKMTKMDRLDLTGTRVTDLSPLSGMTELTELRLDDTPVSDLSPLAKLEKLESVYIKRTNVKDLTPLRGSKALKKVYANGAPIDDPFVLTQPGVKVIED